MFQVQAKISTVRPVFPDYLSVSYDYVYIQVNIIYKKPIIVDWKETTKMFWLA